MEVDEKYVEVKVAMGITEKELREVYDKLIDDKSIDCESRMLKAIMALDMDDNKKAYFCYRFGKAAAEKRFGDLIANANVIKVTPENAGDILKELDREIERLEKINKKRKRDEGFNIDVK